MFDRYLKSKIEESLFKGKLIMLLGPRQTGKTTLIRQIVGEQTGSSLYLTGDDPAVRTRLTDISLAALQTIVGNHRIIVLDEAQRITNIGITLKLIADHFPQTQIIATGSSSFDLANQINEPLTGRKTVFHLFPISWHEWAQQSGTIHAESDLEQRLLYGMYPEVLMRPGEEKEVLAELASDNLYKDLLSFAPIRKPELLVQLLQALALQIGSEVSWNELSNLLKADKQTVSNYVTALEQAFVIFRLGPFSRNLRQEIATTRKVYFYDLGIRNALIGNFAPLHGRADKGAMWENFVISERLKYNRYARRHFLNTYFWRTKQGQEIDYLEEEDGLFQAYEIKWDGKKARHLPASFSHAYPNTQFETLSTEGFAWFFELE